MNQDKRTITTLEVAEMMETEHWKLLRKIEGRTDNKGNHDKGYIDILNNHKMVVADFFIKSSYIDAKGEERPYYEVTKSGCDFLANKFTGEKGVILTARYVKKFNEMEQGKLLCPLDPIIASSVAELGWVTRGIMKDQGSAPYKIAEAFKMQCEQFGIRLPEDFVKVPEYEQISMFMVKVDGD